MSVTYFAPFVKETTNTEGTIDYVLAGAVAGFQSFSAGAGDGSRVVYGCNNDTDFEIGHGYYNSGTLSRDTILASSNSGSKVNWAAGAKEIFVTIPPQLFNVFCGSLGFKYAAPQSDVDGNGSYAIGTGHVVIGDKALALGHNAQSRLGYNLVYAQSKFTTAGDGQLQILSGIATTTNATPTGIDFWMEPGAGDTGTIMIRAEVVARQIGGAGNGDSKGWVLLALLKFTAGNPVLVGSVTTTVVAADAGASAWTTTIDPAGDGLVAVTGEASKTIHWHATIFAGDLGG